MTEPTPSSDHTERLTTPPAASGSVEPQTVYVPQPPSRLNKAAAWVGIVAGVVFIVAVIFGSGFVLGKSVGAGPSYQHRGHEMGPRQGPGMFPPGMPGGFERGPGFHGPFGDGPVMETPRRPGSPSAPATTTPPRP
jgi:hypothetical protein